jgi:predicted phosphatase
MAMMLEAEHTSETLVYFETTWSQKAVATVRTWNLTNESSPQSRTLFCKIHFNIIISAPRPSKRSSLHISRLIFGMHFDSSQAYYVPRLVLVDCKWLFLYRLYLNSGECLYFRRIYSQECVAMLCRHFVR